MGVPSRYILHHGAVLRALARGAVTALRQRSQPSTSAGPPPTPGPTLLAEVPPLPADLVRAYVRHVGGDPASYRDELPPHLFPQWVFPLQARTLQGIHYPMLRVLNGGCRMEVRAPLPLGQPLHVSARLLDVDDDGRRARLHQRAVTGTRETPEALITDLFVIVPLGRSDGGGAAKRERARIPRGAREIAYLRIGADAGLSFAKLTGDFNPVHWVPAYARAMGFGNVILHGFSTMARTFEGLSRHLWAGDTHRLRVLDVRFTRPLVLPASVGLYIDRVENEQRVYVGDAPGGPAHLAGTYRTELEA